MSVADFQPVIGLEVHAQLLTRTKLFCGCSTQFGKAPNANTCPVCLGMPGVLPVLNQRAVEMAVRTGLALGCVVQPVSIWSRKNYFYPDLPKGYQVSQYDRPICEGGLLRFEAGGEAREVRLRRIHLEEDAGKSVHDASGGESLVDLNRAGVPLMELVSEPDLRSAEEAAEYLKALRDILVYLEVNDGNLEEGSFRCDANVSVMRKGSTAYGTRVELKNINSFRFVRQAIDYEIERQVELIESGGAVKQETRLFDPDRGETRAMRGKEEAHDYRYFPEPDLPPLVVPPELMDEARRQLPELPRAKRERFVRQYALSESDARALVSDRGQAELFERCAATGRDPKRLCNWFLGELARLANERSASVATLGLSAEHLSALLKLVEEGAISNNVGKEVLAEVLRSGRSPEEIVREKGLGQVSDAAAIEAVVDEVLAKNASEIERYKAGKKNVFGFFMGQVMKAMKGQGNPQMVNELLKKKLGD